MSYTEFCCRSSGSNMNGGAIASNGEPTAAPIYSATAGAWSSGSGVFTPASGNPAATVVTSDWANVFPDGATQPVFIGRVTAVTSLAITVSLTAKGGTAPATTSSGTSINVGGAWLGPNSSFSFPFNFATGAMTNASSNQMRVNFRSSASYTINSSMTHSVSGPVTFQGYTSSFGDLGKATISGSTTGTSYVLLTPSGNGVDRTSLVDLIFQNNGATGSQPGLFNLSDPRIFLLRVVVNNVRGNGFDAMGIGVECEAYACNQSNTANAGGFGLATSLSRLIRCNSHDNTGSNSAGFYDQGGNNILINCIADSNGSHGMFCNNITCAVVTGCDFYNNGGSGFFSQTANMSLYCENSNFVLNSSFGINITSGQAGISDLYNNGFGSGSAANGSGATNGTSNAFTSGSVTYASGSTPWVDPANGDFRITLATAINAGRGNFTQSASSLGSGTIGYPDIGAAQHLESASSGGTTTVVYGVMGS